MNELTKKASELRRDIVELTYRAKAGHIGGDLSVIDILTVLYYNVMNVSPEVMDDPDRDRFILSKGHCAEALYAVLGDKKYFDKQELISTFSTYQSRFIGHPSLDVPGIEMNSGSLGHGLSLGVGTALAAKMDNRSYRTYVVLGDGEMAEGSNYEAMMSAAHYKLDNLCATIDVNGLQISGSIKDVMNIESLSEKFISFGWHVIDVLDGNDCSELLKAYEAARNVKNKPVVVLAHTVKGKGISFMEHNLKWHHGVMTEEEYKLAIKELTSNQEVSMDDSHDIVIKDNSSMNMIPNRQIICDVLLGEAKTDKDITVVCSDSRGSSSFSEFAKSYPEQFVEMGIAEQNLVTVSAGLASCGKKVFAASPACFLSTRSYEQAKVDVAYSSSNVTLIGVSGGVSYGALGMTHHSCQDIAAFAALPDMRVYLPSDRFQTAELIKALLKDDKPSYVRVSRLATEDVYGEEMDFTLNKACVVSKGSDVLLVACGEMVPNAVRAAELLAKKGLTAGVLDMYCLKPFDEESLIHEAKEARCVVTVEEHSPFGGLGSMTAQVISRNCPKKVINLSLPDGHIVSGTNQEIFKQYGLDGEGIARKVEEIMTSIM